MVWQPVMGGRSTGNAVIPSAILGTIIFVLTEVMFFTALISAYLVIKGGTVGGWVPPDSVTLPVAATALNTLILFGSGISLFFAGRAMTRGRVSMISFWYLQALILGAIFVGVQGYEWVGLIQYGMTITSGLFAACFYLLIGSHAVHAASAILLLGWYYFRLKSGKLTAAQLGALQIYWYFIVGVWPVLYGLVYF